MISSYKDYRNYLEADRVALARGRYTFISWLMDDIWNFQRLLRRIEYLQNCKRGFGWSLLRKFLYFKLHRLAVKLGFSIPVNTFGPGLSIAHYGPIIVNTATRVGKNCRIHVGVNIGEVNGKAPQIGDNVYIGPGAKLFGDIVIGDNVKIGANAVVNKSFPEGNCTLVGVPARKVGE